MPQNPFKTNRNKANILFKLSPHNKLTTNTNYRIDQNKLNQIISTSNKNKDQSNTNDLYQHITNTSLFKIFNSIEKPCDIQSHTK